MTDPSTGPGILYEALGPSKTLPGLLSAVEAPGIAKVAHGPFDRLRDRSGILGDAGGLDGCPRLLFTFLTVE